MYLLKKVRKLEKSDDGFTTLTVTVRDRDGSLIRLLEHIKATANVGHSFSVLVDPDASKDEQKSFGIDGDGGFFLKDIKESQG